MTEEEIHKLCNKYNIKYYTINSDGSIDVRGNVSIVEYDINYIPIKFNKVSGYFYCSGMNLTSLNNCPIEVGGWFNCSYNNLTSFESLPKNHKYELFMCYGNPLKSFDGYNCSLKTLFCDYKEKIIRKSKIKNIIDNI